MSARTLANVVALHDAHHTAAVRAKRLGENADIEKRRLYRKAHGIAEKKLFGFWDAYEEEEGEEGGEGPKRESGADTLVAEQVGAVDVHADAKSGGTGQEKKGGWLGVF